MEQSRRFPTRTGRQARLARALLAAGARAILPDMRGFGASGKPCERSAYEGSAHSRDVVALIDHLRLDAVEVIRFSMSCSTAARLLALHPPQVKAAILAGVGDYALDDNVMEFPKNWPIPDSVTRPITRSMWAEEGTRILEHGEIVRLAVLNAPTAEPGADAVRAQGEL